MGNLHFLSLHSWDLAAQAGILPSSRRCMRSVVLTSATQFKCSQREWEKTPLTPFSSCCCRTKITSFASHRSEGKANLQQRMLYSPPRPPQPESALLRNMHIPWHQFEAWWGLNIFPQQNSFKPPKWEGDVNNKHSSSTCTSTLLGRMGWMSQVQECQQESFCCCSTHVWDRKKIETTWARTHSLAFYFQLERTAQGISHKQKP